MGTGVAGVGDQFVDRPSLNSEIAQDEFLIPGSRGCVLRDLHGLGLLLGEMRAKSRYNGLLVRYRRLAR